MRWLTSIMWLLDFFSLLLLCDPIYLGASMLIRGLYAPVEMILWFIEIPRILD